MPTPGIDPHTGRRVPHTRLLGQASCAFVENYPAHRAPHHGATATTVNLTVDLGDLRAHTGRATTSDGGREEEPLARRVPRAASEASSQPMWVRMFAPATHPTVKPSWTEPAPGTGGEVVQRGRQSMLCR